MDEPRFKAGTGVGLMTAAPSGRVAGSSPPKGHRAFTRVHRRAQTLDRRRVYLARRRLAAGRYDSSELLDTVLEMVLRDLTS